MRFLFLAIILFFPNLSFSQLPVGHAKYAIQSKTFDCDTYINQMASVPRFYLSMLWNTFGKNNACLKRVIAEPNFRGLQVHLMNETCNRGGTDQCGSYEFLDNISPQKYTHLLLRKDKKFLLKFDRYQTKIAQFLFENLPEGTSCWVSPGLESNLGVTAAKKLIKRTRKNFAILPQCRIVFNPVSNNPNQLLCDADVFESHGIAPRLAPPCIADLDGDDIYFSDRPRIPGYQFPVVPWSQIPGFISRYSHCEAVFLWTIESNCIHSSNFVLPRNRDCGSIDKSLKYIAAELSKNHKPTKNPNKEWTEKENLSKVGCKKYKPNTDFPMSGFLFKTSDVEIFGGVILFPCSYPKYTTVEVQHKGKVIDNYVQYGVYSEDGSNRPMWRSWIKPTAYPMHVVIRMDGGKNCIVIDNPHLRHD